MTQMLQHCLIVAAAGAVGAVTRFLVATACGRLFGTGFPIGTLAINVGGSLLLGWFITALSERVIASYGTAQRLFNYLRVAMPYGAPGSLAEGEYWDLVAFLTRDRGFVVDPAEAGPRR